MATNLANDAAGRREQEGTAAELADWILWRLNHFLMQKQRRQESIGDVRRLDWNWKIWQLG